MGLAVLGIALVVVLYSLLTTAWGVPEVRVVNNLEYDVGFRSCKSWRELGRGKATDLRPNGPCSVYRLEGSLQTYLGCLSFPERAFTRDKEVFVGDFDDSLSQEDCARGESYDDYAPASKAMHRILDWITP
jgi:hypothetical protein